MARGIEVKLIVNSGSNSGDFTNCSLDTESDASFA